MIAAFLYCVCFMSDKMNFILHIIAASLQRKKISKTRNQKYNVSNIDFNIQTFWSLGIKWRNICLENLVIGRLILKSCTWCGTIEPQYFELLGKILQI